MDMELPHYITLGLLFLVHGVLLFLGTKGLLKLVREIHWWALKKSTPKRTIPMQMFLLTFCLLCIASALLSMYLLSPVPISLGLIVILLFLQRRVFI